MELKSKKTLLEMLITDMLDLLSMIYLIIRSLKEMIKKIRIIPLNSS